MSRSYRLPRQADRQGQPERPRAKGALCLPDLRFPCGLTGLHEHRRETARGLGAEFI